MGIKVTYSSAAGYIREALMQATSSKLNTSTIRDRRERSGQMYGLVTALDILRRSPEGKDWEVGYPDYHGTNEGRVLEELERYVGGRHRMIELGFYEIDPPSPAQESTMPEFAA